MGNLIDLTGQTFGRWTVLGRGSQDRANRPKWRCVCECGETGEVHGQALRRGNSTSCGCARRDFGKTHGVVHGRRSHPLYNTWKSMKARCENTRAPSYRWYGALGVKVCERWRHSIDAFIEDMGPKPGPGYTVDRIDPTGDYEPGNCRWATRKQQAANRR